MLADTMCMGRPGSGRQVYLYDENTKKTFIGFARLANLQLEIQILE